MALLEEFEARFQRQYKWVQVCWQAVRQVVVWSG